MRVIGRLRVTWGPRAVVLLATLASLAGSTHAQSPGDSLIRRRVQNGVSFLLPASWRTISDSTQHRLASVVDTTLSNSRDTLIQSSLRKGKPVTLLPQTIGAADLSVNLNISPTPGVVPGSFGSLPPARIIAAMAPLCNSMRGVYEGLGARLITCGPATLDQAAGRTIVVTKLVRTGPRGFVTVWIVQYPDHGVMYTLTLQSPQADEQRNASLLQKMWRSMEIPAE